MFRLSNLRESETFSLLVLIRLLLVLPLALHLHDKLNKVNIKNEKFPSQHAESLHSPVKNSPAKATVQLIFTAYEDFITLN